MKQLQPLQRMRNCLHMHAGRDCFGRATTPCFRCYRSASLLQQPLLYLARQACI